MFHATNFSVIVLLIMAATLIMMMVRHARPLEDNWPVLYWAILFVFASGRPDAFKPEVALIGLACGMMLRFEFMSRGFSRLFRLVEFTACGYILVRGVNLVIY